MIGIIVTGVLMVIFLIVGCILLFNEDDDTKALSKIAFAFVISMVIPFVVNLRDYMLPHHGESPTIKDVPKEAYVDTVRTIRSSGKEVISYDIRWNDDRD